jgi:hypothetical protein
MTYSLVFGFSSSRDYARAVRIASAVPGYASEGAGHDILHYVPVEASTAPLLDELLALVSAWRTSRLLADGVAIGRPGALRTVLDCQRQRLRSGLGALHCWGLPAVERGRVPCRLLERALPWRLAGEYANSRMLPRLLAAHARELLLDACPAYDGRMVLRHALASRGRPRQSAEDALQWELVATESEGGDEDAWSWRTFLDLDPDGADELDS